MKASGLEFEQILSAPSGIVYGEWVSVDETPLYINPSYELRVHTSVSNIIYTVRPHPMGTGRIEITTDPIQNIIHDIEDGTNFTTAVPWPNNNVSSLTQRVSLNVTAFRLVVETGTMHCTARGA